MLCKSECATFSGKLAILRQGTVQAYGSQESHGRSMSYSHLEPSQPHLYPQPRSANMLVMRHLERCQGNSRDRGVSVRAMLADLSAGNSASHCASSTMWAAGAAGPCCPVQAIARNGARTVSSADGGSAQSYQEAAMLDRASGRSFLTKQNPTFGMKVEKVRMSK